MYNDLHPWHIYNFLKLKMGRPVTIKIELCMGNCTVSQGSALPNQNLMEAYNVHLILPQNLNLNITAVQNYI